VDRGVRDWVWRAKRRRTDMTGTARRADGSALRVLASNISYEGCHLWTHGELDKGEMVQLCIAGMSLIRAQVRWATGDGAGVKFVTGDSVADERRARLGV
jgi:PilZ domain